jgi:hypothetical protein
MAFKDELEKIAADSKIGSRDLWSCLQNCYDNNLGQGCCDACYNNNPSAAVTPELKAKVKALMERHKKK